MRLSRRTRIDPCSCGFAGIVRVALELFSIERVVSHELQTSA